MTETTDTRAQIDRSRRARAAPAHALCLVLAVMLQLLSPLPAMARGDDAPASSMVIDANTGAVLNNKEGDAPRFPASLTKMMTLYMTFELIELGRLDYTSKIKMTEEGAAAAPSKLELAPGEEISVRDAIKALVTKSANDVAIALAQHIGGNEANFARLMTQKARAIGMSKTTFRNASGLPDPDQVTTARDMLTLALRLQDDFPQEYELFSTRTFSWAGHTYRNHNTLLGRYKGTDGIKTGYTRASGFNLVASVRRDGKHLVAAVFGGETAASRNARMRSILDASFAKASHTVSRKPSRFLHAPAPVAAKSPPRPRERVAAAETAAPLPRTASASAAPAFAMAKVRAVPMKPRAGEGAPQGDTDDPAAPDTVAPDTRAEAAPEPSQSPSPTPPPTPMTLPQFAQGLAPSTLDAQAAALAGPQPDEAVRETGAVRTAALAPEKPRAAPAGSLAIQIGAFSDAGEAERQLQDARHRAGGLLDGYSAVAEPGRKGSAHLFRARFRGFGADTAATTCNRLRRLKIDCFVVGAE
jgi:D-alanyl-D-alanine carboxypeptidase